MPSTALRLLQQLVKKSESNLCKDGKAHPRARRCWKFDMRMHRDRVWVSRNIRQAHMNPASSQKPASIKHFCDTMFLRCCVVMRLAYEFFLLSSRARDARRAGFDAENFFSQAPSGSACEGRFKFENERIGESLIRLGGLRSALACHPGASNRVDETFFSAARSLEGGYGASNVDANLHRAILHAASSTVERPSRCR
jgi:hypothetical protein